MKFMRWQPSRKLNLSPSARWPSPPRPAPLRAASPSVDRLRTLLLEREQAVADARDAAAQFGIPAGPEMDEAVAFSTSDLDRAHRQADRPRSGCSVG